MQPPAREDLLFSFIRKMIDAPKPEGTFDPRQTMRMRFLQFKPWIGKIKKEAGGVRGGKVKRAFEEWKRIEAEGKEMLQETRWLKMPDKK